ncbi:MAG TPA: hypothetical protein VF614_06105, partial [Chthoniobacteraceae bacterium]
MIIAVTVLAGLGLFFTILGRWLILQEAAEMPRGWRLALRILPLADLVYVTMWWEKAKMGSAACLIGLALLSPMVGQVVSDFVRPQAHNGSGIRFKDQVASLLKTDRQTTERQAERTGRENLAHHKDVKVRELSAHLVGWHSSLEQRRAAFLAGGGGDVSAFDHEAALYHNLLAAAKVEASEL